MAGIARIVGANLIENALIAAFEEWVEEDVNDDYWAEEFFQSKWPYDSITKRKNGDTVGPGPRDIVDTQALYDSGVESLKVTKRPTEVRADWHWNAKNSSGSEYAWYVHEGKGPHSVEPRKWTDELSDPGLFEGSMIKRKLLDRIDSSLNSR